jgi:S1-C subfamily serine protease
MKALFAPVLAVAIALSAIAPFANAAEGDSITFNLKVSAGAAACLKSDASGKVTVSDLGLVQNMHIETFNLPPNTEFSVFLLQVPHSPFGLTWYQGDIRTNANGKAVGDFTGIFSKETFIQGPGPAPAPQVFRDDATTNPATAPIQLYHLGIWFADPNDAANATCPATVTPFDGDHEAGIQVLNTTNFADTQGPLLRLQ